MFNNQLKKVAETGTSSDVIKKTIQEKINELTTTSEKTKLKREKLEAHIAGLKHNKENLKPLIKQLDEMGKTPKEIREEKAKKRAEADGAKQTTGGGTQQTEETQQEQTTADDGEEVTPTTQGQGTQTSAAAKKTADAATATVEAQQPTQEQSDAKELKEEQTAETWISLLINEETDNAEEAKKYFTKKNSEYNTKSKFSGNEAINCLQGYYYSIRKTNCLAKAREKVLAQL